MSAVIAPTKKSATCRRAIAAVLLLMLTACHSNNSNKSDVDTTGESNGTGTTIGGQPLYQPSACQDTLVFANGSAAPVAVDYPVDYCRELVIVDHEVLAQLRGYAFADVMATITAQPKGAALDNLVNQWALSWTRSDAYDNDATDQREFVAISLLKAWQAQSIDLIAVTNRLDLPEPEGRLVYQLRDGDSMQVMTLIAEFHLPLARAEEAGHWHRLGNPGLSKDAFVAELVSNLQRVVTFDNFAQLRSNEQLDGPTWQLREFRRAADNSLALAKLDSTPADSLQANDTIAALVEVLSQPAVAQSLRDGNRDYLNVKEWQALTAIKASFDPALPIWPRLTGTDEQKESLFLMSFNTCNGCHHDMDKSSRQLFRPRAGENAALSDFLSGAVAMEYPLPECRRDSKAPGCGARSWNEKERRTGELARLLRSGTAAADAPDYRQH